MERKRHEEELRRSIHVVILICYTLYVIGLVFASIANKWELWAVPILIIGVVVCWSLYVRQNFDAKFTNFFYAGFVALSTFYYGSHPDSFYNASLVIVLGVLLFCLTMDRDVLRIITLTYSMLIMYHILLVITKRESMEEVNFSVSLMHVIAVIVAYYVAVYLCEMLVASANEARALEEALADSKAKAEDFMANVSHELRTPINVVTGLSSVLLKDEKSDQKRADLSAIQSAGRRLFGRIEDILDYTEVDTDSLSLSEDDYRISSIVNDIVSQFRVEARNNSPEFVVDMDVNIPARMVGDAAKIRRIIRHLVVNSCKFTGEAGCVNLRIFTRKKEYGVNLCIEVTDTGIGMSEEELDKVVKGVFQSDSGRSRRADGIGLGLYIVYGFVKRMGGFVHIESEKNKGTKVIVSIPQKVIDEKPSVVLDNPEKLEIVCFLKPEKYKSPAIREYYNMMIVKTIRGLGVPLHKVSSFDELKTLCQGNQVTHVFISEDEYNEDRQFFENIKKEISVICSVPAGFKIPRDSKATFLKKPVFSHSLVNAVNRAMTVWEFDPETSGKRLSFEGVRALVVDDEEMNLIVAKGVLSGYGMDVTFALSGREAVKLCEKERFDVIFMDHMMPEMDGVEAMKTIRKNAGSDDKTAIVAFTANAVSGVREMFKKEGFDEFLAKPIESFELERILKKLLPSTMWKYEEVKEKEIIFDKRDESSDEDERFVLLNYREGKRICRGSDALYEEVLLEYTRNLDEMMTELRNLYEEKNWEDYRIKLNGLKLSARLIGASELAKEAMNIERAAEGKWEAYIFANHDDLERKAVAIRDEINRVYGGDAS